ncbi:MAG TPA: hypothetical protein VGV38_10870, partial [Pyrinomonadaceae bacterium]|nr:hypothetical protein [Pyrinomonadaceae bacterium]
MKFVSLRGGAGRDEGSSRRCPHADARRRALRLLACCAALSVLCLPAAAQRRGGRRAPAQTRAE